MSGERSNADQDHDALRSRIAERLVPVERMLASHAGGIRLLDVTADGTARLRFSGMCVGCMLRPVTMAMVVAPALLEIPGVTGLDVAGTRVSIHAQARLAAIRDGTLAMSEPGDVDRHATSARRSVPGR